VKKIYSDIIQFRGSHYDFGYMQGQLLKDSLTIKNRENQWKVRRPRFQIHAEEAKQAITAFAPGIWEELLGFQEALQWPLEKVLMEFGGYRVEIPRSGCSVLTGDGYLIRNYDYHPKTYEGRYVFFQPSDSGYATAGPSQRITGRSDGINEKGLVMGYNFMNRKNPGDGFICGMIGRIVLETCANVEEATALLKEIPHRGSFSYIVFDRSNKTLVAEATPREVKVREVRTCTNHFEILKHENRGHLADSERRLAILEKELDNLNEAHEAFRLFNDPDKGVFSDLYASWAGTIHTAAYFPKELKAWFALGGDQAPAVLDFGDWLAGSSIPLDQVAGEVNTDIPFVHMDEHADWFRR
jgi:predicted choloylglycine hydrolase